MLNQKIAEILYNIADILELQDIKFKPQAYRNAARGIENLSEDIALVYKHGKLEEIPGVGEHIAKKIEEIIFTGRLKYYEQLKKETQIDIEGLNQIPGLGPKKIKVLYQKLKVKTLRDLEKAIKNKTIRELPGFGEKSEEILKQGFDLLKRKPQRWPWKEAQPVVERILKHFKKSTFVKRIEVVGSFRRKKATIGDLDFLVISKNAEKVMNHFLSFPEKNAILSHGKTRSSIRLKNDLQVDLRVFKKEEFGAAMLYFIGSKEFNINIRKIALSKGYTLNEYGLYDLKTKTKVAGRNEREIFKILGLKYLPPEKREIEEKKN